MITQDSISYEFEYYENAGELVGRYKLYSEDTSLSEAQKYFDQVPKIIKLSNLDITGPRQILNINESILIVDIDYSLINGAKVISDLSNLAPERTTYYLGEFHNITNTMKSFIRCNLSYDIVKGDTVPFTEFPITVGSGDSGMYPDVSEDTEGQFVEFYLQWDKVPVTNRPESLDRNLYPSYNNPINATDYLNWKTLGDKCFGSLRIYNGLIPAPLFEIKDILDSHFICQTKVIINESKMTEWFIDHLGDNYDTYKILIYPPSYYFYPAKNPETYLSPIPNFTNREFKQLIFRAPKNYKSDGNIQYELEIYIDKNTSIFKTSSLEDSENYEASQWFYSEGNSENYTELSSGLPPDDNLFYENTGSPSISSYNIKYTLSDNARSAIAGKTNLLLKIRQLDGTYGTIEVEPDPTYPQVFTRIVPPVYDWIMNHFSGDEYDILIRDASEDNDAFYKQSIAYNGEVFILGSVTSGVLLNTENMSNRRIICPPLRSTDAGMTWSFPDSVQISNTFNEAQANKTFSGVTVLEANKETGRFSACILQDVDGFGFIYSDDNGVTWQSGTTLADSEPTEAFYTIANRIALVKCNQLTGADERWVMLGEDSTTLNISNDGITWRGPGSSATGYYGGTDINGAPGSCAEVSEGFNACAFIPGINKWVFNKYYIFPGQSGLWICDNDFLNFQQIDIYSQFATAVGASTSASNAFRIIALEWIGDKLIALVTNTDTFNTPFFAIMQSTNGTSWSTLVSNPFNWGSEYNDLYIEPFNPGGFNYHAATRITYIGDKIILPYGMSDDYTTLPAPDDKGPRAIISVSEDGGLTWTNNKASLTIDNNWSSGQRLYSAYTNYLDATNQQRMIGLDDMDWASASGMIVSNKETEVSIEDTLVSSASNVYESTNTPIIVSSMSSVNTNIVIGATTWTRAAFLIEITNPYPDFARKDIRLISAPWLPIAGPLSNGTWQICNGIDSYNSSLISWLQNINNVTQPADSTWTIQFNNNGNSDYTVSRLRIITFN